jgi:DNA-directed RNA polymerase specialized sigma24 family protein
MAISHPLIRDNENLSRIRSGEEEVFEALFREHYAGLCVFATRILGSRAVAEETVQDVFWKCASPRWSSSSSTAPAWTTSRSSARRTGVSCLRIK